MRLTPVALAFALFPTIAPAADVDGVWRTERGETGAFLEVEIGPCAGDAAARCGVITRAEGVRRGDLVGKPMITGMKPDGAGGWADGEIWAPDDDKTYDATMKAAGGALEVEGCFLVFCRGQSWTRVE